MTSFFDHLLSDRITRGIVAGLVSYIPALAYNLIAHALGFSALIWKDYMNVFLHGEIRDGVLAQMISVVATSIFVGALGGFFSLISPVLSSKHYLLKTWYYSVGLWFAIHSITVLYDVPKLAVLSTQTVISQSIAATIWGLCLGLVLNYVEGLPEG